MREKTQVEKEVEELQKMKFEASRQKNKKKQRAIDREFYRKQTTIRFRKKVAGFCKECGESVLEKKFCTNCGTAVD